MFRVSTTRPNVGSHAERATSIDAHKGLDRTAGHQGTLAQFKSVLCLLYYENLEHD